MVWRGFTISTPHQGGHVLKTFVGGGEDGPTVSLHCLFFILILEWRFTNHATVVFGVQQTSMLRDHNAKFQINLEERVFMK